MTQLHPESHSRRTRLIGVLLIAATIYLVTIFADQIAITDYISRICPSECANLENSRILTQTDPKIEDIQVQEPQIQEKQVQKNLETLAQTAEIVSLDFEKSQKILNITRKLRQRKTFLREQCAKHNLYDKHEKVSRFRETFVNFLDTQDTIMCFIPKAGSTNWKKVFNAIKDHTLIKNEGPKLPNGRLYDHFYHKLPRFEFDKKYKGKSIDSIDFEHWSDRFITVRHPFVRLYSAWKDKFNIHTDFPDYEKHLVTGKWLKYTKIIRKFEKQPPFLKFEKRSRVDFKAFLEYIVQEKGYGDTHWASYWDECAPCKIKYNIISKLESVDEDVEYIFSLIDAPTRIGEFPKTSFNSKKQSAAMNKDVETVSEIFRRLEPELVEKLYQKYKWDFVLFDYSHEEFFNRTGIK